MKTYSNRNGLTLTELLAVIAILGVLMAILLPAIQASREAARNISCKNNFKNVILATLNFQSCHDKFPVGIQRIQQADHLHVKTWAALISPHLEQRGVNIEYDDGLCICSSENQKALLNPGSVFICPSMPVSNSLVEFEAGNAHRNTGAILATSTHIHPPGEIGEELKALIKTNSRTLIRDETNNQGERLIPDGTSNTIVFVEALAPDRYLNNKLVSGEVQGGSCFLPGTSFVENICDFKTNFSQNSHGINSWGKSSFTYHPGGLTVGFADGHIRSLSENINQRIYASLLSINGGEVTTSL